MKTPTEDTPVSERKLKAVAWEFRSNEWPEGTWSSITEAQYRGYLSGNVTGPRDAWQVRALVDIDDAERLYWALDSLLTDVDEHRGTGYAEFDSEEEARAALQRAEGEL